MIDNGRGQSVRLQHTAHLASDDRANRNTNQTVIALAACVTDGLCDNLTLHVYITGCSITG